MIVGIEESYHGPSDAMHNPSHPFEFHSKETCGSQLQPPITKTKNIRVILFSIHGDDGNPSRAIIKQALRESYALSWEPCQRGSSKLNLLDHRYKLQCCSLVPAKSDSLPHAHAQAFKVKHSASRLLLLNKNVISQKAQVHVKFSNSDNYKIPHHQRYSTSNKEVFSREIVSLRSILWEIDRIDEEEEVISFRDKYDHVGQKHKLIKKVKSR
ncbi:hypothetical protein Tco_1252619 [Tanacetum coccineum]